MQFEGLANVLILTNVSNNNHTATFTFNYGYESETPTVSGSPFVPLTYKFAQMHFHFDENNG